MPSRINSIFFVSQRVARYATKDFNALSKLEINTNIRRFVPRRNRYVPTINVSSTRPGDAMSHVGTVKYGMNTSDASQMDVEIETIVKPRPVKIFSLRISFMRESDCDALVIM